MLPTVITYHVERNSEEAPADVLAAVAQQVALAETLGYSGAWFAEHHFGSQRGVLPSPLLLAAHVAAQTQCLRVGTSIICLPLHHPVNVAEDVAVADLLSGGRLDIGFGSGSSPADFAVFGSSQPERHARFEEALEVLRHCWSGETFDFTGRYYQMQQVRCIPTPQQTPAEFVWLAASSAPTAQLAGRLGFGLQLPRGRAAQDYVPIITAYRDAWSDAGHPADRCQRVSIARCLYVGVDDDDAMRTVEAATRRFAQRGPAAIPGAPEIGDLLARLHFCVGRPEAVLAHLRELRAVTGLTHLSMQPTWENLPADATCSSLRRYAELVAPEL
ncbi:MAG TPA: LLM class flavin-dependent oxidoreductase [Chloroflexota bacterium]|nr:LLM class flavin-dependent oxidoreductase [Chloroflexota bacterium]